MSVVVVDGLLLLLLVVAPLVIRVQLSASASSRGGGGDGDGTADVVQVEAATGELQSCGAGAVAICCLAFYTMVTRFDCCLVDCLSAYLCQHISLWLSLCP